MRCYIVAKNARLNIAIMPSTKQQLQAYCMVHDGLNMGDVVDIAIKQYIEHETLAESCKPIVMERLGQLLNSQEQIIQLLQDNKHSE